MAIPQGRMSTTPVPGTYGPPDDRAFHALTSYEKGPIEIENTSEGLQYQNWTLHWSPTTNLLTAFPETTQIPVSLITVADLVSVTFTFDQNGRISFTWTTDTSSYLYWYDTAVGNTVTTDLGADAITPSLNLDDKRATQSAVSDMLLWYTKANGETFDLYMLRQRDRFTIEYLMEAGLPYQYVENLGMNNGLRVQVAVRSYGDYDPSGLAPEQALAILDEARQTGWIDQTLLPIVTFEETFGVPVHGDDFTQVIPVGNQIAVTSITDDVRMYVVDSLDASEVIMISIFGNGNVSGSIHYLGYPLPQTTYLPLQKDLPMWIAIASDTGNARIRKQDFTIQETL